MLKALCKKQFLEINQFYFKDPKTGENRSTKGVIGFVALFVLVFACVAFAFCGIADLTQSILLPLNLDWLYMGIGGVLSLLAASILSLFFCYNSIFRSKDNTLLLALPIPPRTILAVRLGGMFLMSLFMSAITWLPYAISYCVFKSIAGAPLGIGQICLCLLTVLIIAILASVLACLIGWILAAIGGHIKNKSLAISAATIVLVLAYFYVYFQFARLLEGAVTALAESIQSLAAYMWPLHQFGQAAMGDVLLFVIWLIIAVALFALVFALMSKTFIKIATTQATATSAKKFESGQVKSTSKAKALLSREFRRVLSIPVYLVNCGLGAVLMVVLAVAALLNGDSLAMALSLIATELPIIGNALPVIVAAAVCFLAGTCVFTAPSVSIEGKELWLIRSLPVLAKDALMAKIQMQIRIAGIPTVLFAYIAATSVGISESNVVLIVFIALAYQLLNAYAGLALNLKHPNFIWSTANVPVKQSMPVALMFLGGWLFCIVLLLLYMVALVNIMNATYFLAGVLVLFVVGAALLRRWVFSRGVQIWDTLC